MITGITWKTDPATLRAQRKSHDTLIKYSMLESEKTARNYVRLNRQLALKDANDHSKHD